MTEPSATGRARAIPASRLSRASRLGGVAAGIATSAAFDGAVALARGQRPEWQSLLVTPANLTRLANQLASMRGAAMKVGQMMSMDAGDMLPPEIADILARLRNGADFMPPKQLQAVLNAEWGAGWRQQFARFDPRPIAAASIGQVHKARLRDGAEVAVKVQYPGVRRAIDSDVDNVASLMRLSGLVPKGMDLAPLLAEAKTQLHEEADYLREAASLMRFRGLMAGRPGFALPDVHQPLTTASVLVMDFMEGVPVEEAVTAPQHVRDGIMERLVGLLFDELMGFRLMQTDPNFANYRWQPEEDRLVLLDFGATRAVPPALAEGYRGLMRAGMAADRAGLSDAGLALGFFAEDSAQRHKDMVLDMVETAFAALRQEDAFDFAGSAIPETLRDQGMAMSAERDFTHVPPADTFFLQRKFGGLFLLGARLNARVALRPMIDQWM